MVSQSNYQSKWETQTQTVKSSIVSISTWMESYILVLIQRERWVSKTWFIGSNTERLRIRRELLLASLRSRRMLLAAHIIFGSDVHHDSWTEFQRSSVSASLARVPSSKPLRLSFSSYPTQEAPSSEEEMMLEVFSYTERVVNMVRPRKLLMMAIGEWTL